MSIQATMDALPRILISKVDEKRLTAIATAASQRVPEASAALLGELERAEVLPETAMPADVVRISSIIEFEVDDGRRLKVQLVLPENADINAGRISVLTPVGAALIGLSPGQSMEWSGNDGKERLLSNRTIRCKTLFNSLVVTFSRCRAPHRFRNASWPRCVDRCSITAVLNSRNSPIGCCREFGPSSGQKVRSSCFLRLARGPWRRHS